jgi:hypothetical protein
MADEVVYPRNDFTEMIERTSSDNRSGVRGGMASATPVPTAQSADFGRPVPEAPPLSDEERIERDRLAASLGITDGALPTEQERYKSLDEAIEAGAPVRPARVPVGAAGYQYGVLGGAMPRLPDFTRVEGIDLLRNRVMVDGMEFPIPEEEAREYKKYVIEVARDAIFQALSAAETLFGEPAPAEGASEVTTRGDEALQRESAGDRAEPQG